MVPGPGSMNSDAESCSRSSLITGQSDLLNYLGINGLFTLKWKHPFSVTTLRFFSPMTSR